MISSGEYLTSSRQFMSLFILRKYLRIEHCLSKLPLTSYYTESRKLLGNLLTD